LNEFPQFLTEIDGQPIHLLHVRSPEPDALPLIITHSWPNSLTELMDVIGPLTDPRAQGGDPAQAFHVVAPSLPGFGFSEFPVPADRPWSAERVARTWAELMSRLGYERYGAHGNDAGALRRRHLRWDAGAAVTDRWNASGTSCGRRSRSLFLPGIGRLTDAVGGGVSEVLAGLTEAVGRLGHLVSDTIDRQIDTGCVGDLVAGGVSKTLSGIAKPISGFAHLVGDTVKW
jgi:hypothetical protein